jgi:hypothetical protein
MWDGFLYHVGKPKNKEIIMVAIVCCCPYHPDFPGLKVQWAERAWFAFVPFGDDQELPDFALREVLCDMHDIKPEIQQAINYAVAAQCHYDALAKCEALREKMRQKTREFSPVVEIALGTPCQRSVFDGRHKGGRGPSKRPMGCYTHKKK